MEVINKLRKKDTISLLKTSYVKSFIKENSYLLSRYKINLPIKKDDDYFYFESLVLKKYLKVLSSKYMMT